MTRERTFRLPDNPHYHFRWQKLLKMICSQTDIYGRTGAMGNVPLIETVKDVRRYRREILKQKPKTKPIVIPMITGNTTTQTIHDSADDGNIFFKFIAAETSTGATKTGLRLFDFDRLKPLFGAIEERGGTLIIHAELVRTQGGVLIPYLLREEAAIPCIEKYLEMVPNLKIVIAHVSTRKMIDFIRRNNLIGELAPHHGILTYDMVFGSDPWNLRNSLNFCLPVAKTEDDRRAVREAMISDDKYFYYATDAASHLWLPDKLINLKPGVFFGINEYVLIYQIFQEMGGSDRVFEDFTSRRWAELHGFPLNEGTITLREEKHTQPEYINGVRLCLGGTELDWRIVEVNGKPIN